MKLATLTYQEFLMIELKHSTGFCWRHKPNKHPFFFSDIFSPSVTLQGWLGKGINFSMKLLNKSSTKLVWNCF